MKKLIPFLLFSSLACAQTTFNVTIESGYMLPFASGKQISNQNYTSMNSINGYTSTSHYKLVPYSMGTGMLQQIRFGVCFSNGIGLETGGAYLSGAPFHVDGRSFMVNDFTTHEVRSEEETYTIEVKGMRQFAGLSFGGAIGKRCDMRITAGIQVGDRMSAIMKDEYTETYEHQSWFTGMDTTETNTRNEKIEYTKGLTWGGYGAIDLTWHLKGGFSAGVRANVLLQNWGPKKGKITEYTLNGIDQLPSMTIADKEADFYDELDITYDSNSSVNENEPSKELRYFYSMNSAGLLLTVRYQFGSSKPDPAQRSLQ